MRKPGHQYRCARCGMTVTLFVAVTQPPTHVCRVAANKIKPLEPMKGKDNE